jgi:hypothetical protein
MWVYACALVLVTSLTAAHGQAPPADQHAGPTEEAERLSKVGTQCVKDEKYFEAASLFLRALALREKTLGAEHIEVARTLTKLGGAYLLLDSSCVASLRCARM